MSSSLKRPLPSSPMARWDWRSKPACTLPLTKRHPAERGAPRLHARSASSMPQRRRHPRRNRWRHQLRCRKLPRRQRKAREQHGRLCTTDHPSPPLSSLNTSSDVWRRSSGRRGRRRTVQWRCLAAGSNTVPCKCTQAASCLSDPSSSLCLQQSLAWNSVRHHRTLCSSLSASWPASLHERTSGDVSSHLRTFDNPAASARRRSKHPRLVADPRGFGPCRRFKVEYL